MTGSERPATAPSEGRSGSLRRPEPWQLSQVNLYARAFVGLLALGVVISSVQYIRGASPLIAPIGVSVLLSLFLLTVSPRLLPYPVRVPVLLLVFLLSTTFVIGIAGFSIACCIILLVCTLAAQVLPRPWPAVVVLLCLLIWSGLAWLVMSGRLPSPGQRVYDPTTLMSTFRTSTPLLVIGGLYLLGVSEALKRLEARLTTARQTNDALLAERKQGAQVNARARLEQHELVKANRLASLGQLSGELSLALARCHSAMDHSARRAHSSIRAALGDSGVDDLAQALLVTQGLIRQLKAYGGRTDSAERSRISADELFWATARTARRLLPPEIALNATSSSPGDITLEVDIPQIHQVLTNLIINARDAMPEGGALTLSAHVEAQQSGAEQAIFKVADTGIGMDSATRSRIFDPFFSTKGPDKGTGLGLATAFSIVHQHHGHLNVESTPGEGSTFTLSLPVQSGLQTT